MLQQKKVCVVSLKMDVQMIMDIHDETQRIRWQLMRDWQYPELKWIGFIPSWNPGTRMCGHQIWLSLMMQSEAYVTYDGQ